MSNPELDRIRSDLTRCKVRIAEMRAGQRGVRTGPWQEADGMPGAGLAFSNQLLAQETALQRLEGEYVQAMLASHAWGPAAVIEAMQHKCEPTQIVTRTAVDPIREVLRESLKAPGFYLSRSKLEELLSQ